MIISHHQLPTDTVCQL